jgi:signal transduction histidine kinase
LRLWPRSLATRTALVLVGSLIVVQVAGLTIHAFDRVDVLRLAQARDIAVRSIGLYQVIALTPAAQRGTVLAAQSHGGVAARIDVGPPTTRGPLSPLPFQQLLQVNMGLLPVPQSLRPRAVVIDGGPQRGSVSLGMRLPDNRWLDVTFPLPAPRPWHSQDFLLAFVLMTVAAAALSGWAVRRLVAPVATLAEAAERLGRDVAAPPLPEDGPAEVATAARAFNTMAARLRRFVADRTFLLAAIGHDLRTPITRLKLRLEFVDDEDTRRRMEADLDELEAMVAASLAFARDTTGDERVVSIDLAELARTILDEAADARPEAAARLGYAGPEHVAIHARPVSLKRAVANLVLNAIKYGGGARVTLRPPDHGTVELLVEDDGPGIPDADMDRVFQPFQRLEPSRSRETGGMGLGLPIARNIFRAHGGDVTLSNRESGGLRATVVLPG